PFIALLFLLPLIRPLLGALAVAGAHFHFLRHRSWLEHSRFAEVHHHLHALPNAHVGHLPHETADLVELHQELLNVVRLDAAAAGDAATAAQVDNVGITSFLLGHGVDHALDAFNGHVR